MDSSAITKNKTALPMAMLNLTGDVHFADAYLLPAGRSPPCQYQKEQKTYHSAVRGPIRNTVRMLCQRNARWQEFFRSSPRPGRSVGTGH
jgi:hypothetical protein